MTPIERGVVLCAAVLGVGTAVAAQEVEDARRAYFRAVANFFDVAESEVAILAEWDLPPDQVPVVMFVARRAGVSAEALLALRRTGRSWPELASRYHVGPAQFHVPLPDRAGAGALDGAYAEYRALPAARWNEIRLSEGDIVTLVNVRVLAQALGVAPERVLAAHARTRSFVDLYAELVRRAGPG